MIERIPLDQIKDNPYQPRVTYHKKDIDELAGSIKEHGLLQVPPGRRKGADVELAFGHQRVRAFRKLAKKSAEKFGEMPVDIRQMTDEQMATFALEENMKRADITPLETARAVDKYLESFKKATEEELGKSLGITKSAISNMRRVLRLPDNLLEKIDAGKLSFTQGRELLTLENVPNGENLMKSAVTNLGRYGRSNTVEGLQGSIYDTARDHFPPLDKEFEGWRWNLLFDTRAAGCLECQKMIRTHPKKSKVAHMCTDEECWKRHQEEHMEAAAAAAKKKMEDDILRRAAGPEEPAPTAPEPEPEEPSPIEEGDYRVQNIITGEFWDGMAASVDDACDCAGWNKKDCWVRIATNKGGWSNRYGHRPVEPPPGKPEEPGDESKTAPSETEEPAGESKPAEDEPKAVPDDLLEKTREAAGTRAEVIDIRPLRVSQFYDDLKSGYAMLDDRTLKNIDDPEECTERCTTGFHYSFNSAHLDFPPGAVCSNPKCLAKKKSAMTKKRNAAGQARKKAEAAAIKEAIAKTFQIGHAEMKLILLAQMDGSHTEHYYYSGNRGKNAETWLWDKLSPGVEKDNRKRPALYKLLDKLSANDLAALVVEFMLYTLTYKGDVGDWETNTSQALKWLGVHIEKPKKEVKEDAE